MPQETHEAFDVAVVGAGPAGIAAAFRLQQAGYRVRVFEAQDRVGGRTKTTRRDGFSFDSGAVNLLSSYTHMLGILRDAGLQDEVMACGSMIGVPLGNDIHYIDADQRIRDIPTLARTGVLSTRSKLKLGRLAYDVVRARPQLSYADLWKATDLDTESAGAYARRVLNDEICDNLVDAVVRGSICLPADGLSKADFFFSLAHWMGVQLLTMRDGMGTYAELMAKQLDIRLQTPALEVEERGDEVQVTYRDTDGEHTARAAACVIAVPAAPSAALVPQLDDWRREYLTNMEYVKSVVMTVAQSRPVDQPAALFLPAKDRGTDVSVITVPNRMTPWRMPPGKGLVTIIVAAGLGQQLLIKDDDDVRSALLPVIEHAVPGLTGDIEWCHIDRWDPLLPVHKPGFTTGLTKFHHLSQQHDRRIQFAGDYWALGCVETSTASGERAAKALMHQLAPASTEHHVTA
jgi:oxygen-dependent protoporphyrinogen oxidase